MNAEAVTVTGTILNPATYASSHFTLQFDVASGRVISAGSPGCSDSTTVLAITNFSGLIADLRVGASPVAAPQDFTAYLASAACPQTYQELVSDSMTLETQGPLFQSGAIIFDGSVGSWWIEAASVQVAADPPPAASVPEPGPAALVALGVAAVLAGRMARSGSFLGLSWHRAS